MNGELLLPDKSVVKASSLAEAVQPLVEWDVRCVVRATGHVKVVAANEREALEKAAALPGVIWPLAVRLAPVDAANASH